MNGRIRLFRRHLAPSTRLTVNHIVPNHILFLLYQGQRHFLHSRHFMGISWSSIVCCLKIEKYSSRAISFSRILNTNMTGQRRGRSGHQVNGHSDRNSQESSHQPPTQQASVHIFNMAGRGRGGHQANGPLGRNSQDHTSQPTAPTASVVGLPRISNPH